MTEQRRTEAARGEAGGTAATGRDPLYLQSVLLVMAAGCFWSIAGILVRGIEAADAWQILFYRSAAVVVTLLCVLLARHGRRTAAHARAAGWAAVVGGLGLAVGFAGFIFALLHTTVANAVFILSAAPFGSALLARLLLGEGVRPATWIAMTVALTGISVMVIGGLGAGALFGNLMALCAMAGFSVFAVALRWGRSNDMLPAACLAGVFAAAVAGWMAEDLVLSGRDLLLCLTMGVVQIGFGMVLFTRGSRHVPAAELALLSLTEVVLGPIWVWLGFGEVPSVTTLLGGAIVLLAIVGQALSGMRRKPPPFGSV